MKKIQDVTHSCGTTFDESAFFSTPERDHLMQLSKVLLVYFPSLSLLHSYYLIAPFSQYIAHLGLRNLREVQDVGQDSNRRSWSCYEGPSLSFALFCVLTSHIFKVSV